MKIIGSAFSFFICTFESTIYWNLEMYDYIYDTFRFKTDIPGRLFMLLCGDLFSNFTAQPPIFVQELFTSLTWLDVLVFLGSHTISERHGGHWLLLPYGLAIFIIIFIILFVVFFLAPSQYSFEKQSSYECGFEPFGDARSAFDIHFYIVGILFLIFDLEIIFLLPWIYSATEGYCSYESIQAMGIVQLFLFILGLGFFYEWRRNALVWVPVRVSE